MTPGQVPGLISRRTGELLQRLAARVPAAHLIVEIGAHQGRSTCYLATGSAAGNRARVVSIDPWTTGVLPGPTRRGVNYLAPQTEAAYRRHLQACGVADLVTPVRGFSQTVPLPSQPVGLLWIDGAHDYDSVSVDITRWCPLVAPGGHVVVDDYRTGRHRGVDRAVRELTRGVGRDWQWDTSLRPLAVGTRPA